MARGMSSRRSCWSMSWSRRSLQDLFGWFRVANYVGRVSGNDIDESALEAMDSRLCLGGRDCNGDALSGLVWLQLVDFEEREVEEVEANGGLEVDEGVLFVSCFASQCSSSAAGSGIVVVADVVEREVADEGCRVCDGDGLYSVVGQGKAFVVCVCLCVVSVLAC